MESQDAKSCRLDLFCLHNLAMQLLYMSVPQFIHISAFRSTSTCLGLIAAPTHFVTGRVVTLFFDERIFGDGAVGLALLQGEQEASTVGCSGQVNIWLEWCFL